jgi:hypothetical protein
MKYAVEIGSGAMIYIQSFTKTGSTIKRLMEYVHGYTDNMVIA